MQEAGTQQGSLIKSGRKRGPDVWQFRWGTEDRTGSASSNLATRIATVLRRCRTRRVGLRLLKGHCGQLFRLRELLMTVSKRTLFMCMLIACLGFTSSAIAQGLDASLPRTLRPVIRGRQAAPNEYPGKHWTQAAKPEDRGWSSEKLAAAKAYADSIDTAAVVIVDDGVIVSQWGETATKFNVHSIRKSFLSALYGIAVAKRQIELNATLDQLGIDDNPPSLTPEEKQARVIDLLKARSGIYHAALYESPAMKAEKPTRGSHPPRSFWSYNNWDFNALGTIYEKLTRDSIYHAFDAQTAQRIGMEDFDPKEQEYVTGTDSIHCAYPFRMP